MQYTEKMFKSYLADGSFSLPSDMQPHQKPRAPEFFLALLCWVMENRENIVPLLDSRTGTCCFIPCEDKK